MNNEGETTPRADFLDALVDELRPVRPALAWIHALGIWTLVSGIFVVAGILASGPLRTGLASDLTHPRFLIELGLGSATLFAVTAAGLELGVPGAPSAKRLLVLTGLLGASWLAIMLVGDPLPGPTHSMLGKREHCFVQILALSLPPTALALLLLRQRLMQAHGAAGACIGAAAALLPAISMQLACMYEPTHALRLHLSPVLLIAVAGAFAGHFLLPRD